MKSIADEFEEIKEKICGEYCKWPNVYSSEHKDCDDAFDLLINEKCDNCPLNRL